jgi:hypothetical protein
MSSLTTAELARIAQDFAARYELGYIGVGDGITPFDPDTQTDLTGTNKARAVITSYNISGSLVTFYATFVNAVANFEWLEAGLFDSSVGGGMAVRQVIDSPGTKPASQEWTYALQVELDPSA